MERTNGTEEQAEEFLKDLRIEFEQSALEGSQHPFSPLGRQIFIKKPHKNSPSKGNTPVSNAQREKQSALASPNNVPTSPSGPVLFENSIVNLFDSLKRPPPSKAEGRFDLN